MTNTAVRSFTHRKRKMLAETFIDLLGDWHHWGFEIIAAVVEFVIVGLIATPLVRRWIRNHDAKAHGHKHCDDAHPEYSVFMCEGCELEYFTGPAWEDECYCEDCYLERFPAPEVDSEL